MQAQTGQHVSQQNIQTNIWTNKLVGLRCRFFLCNQQVVQHDALKAFKSIKAFYCPFKFIDFNVQECSFNLVLDLLLFNDFKTKNVVFQVGLQSLSR